MFVNVLVQIVFVPWLLRLSVRRLPDPFGSLDASLPIGTYRDMLER
jgi:hypothetical protein